MKHCLQLTDEWWGGAGANGSSVNPFSVWLRGMLALVINVDHAIAYRTTFYLYCAHRSERIIPEIGTRLRLFDVWFIRYHDNYSLVLFGTNLSTMGCLNSKWIGEAWLRRKVIIERWFLSNWLYVNAVNWRERVWWYRLGCFIISTWTSCLNKCFLVIAIKLTWFSIGTRRIRHRHRTWYVWLIVDRLVRFRACHGGRWRCRRGCLCGSGYANVHAWYTMDFLGLRRLGGGWRNGLFRWAPSNLW